METLKYVVGDKVRIVADNNDDYEVQESIGTECVVEKVDQADATHPYRVTDEALPGGMLWAHQDDLEPLVVQPARKITVRERNAAGKELRSLLEDVEAAVTEARACGLAVSGIDIDSATISYQPPTKEF